MFVVQDDFNLIPFNLIGLPEDGTFQDYIDAQEEERLRKLLGNIFYDVFAAAVTALPDEYDSATEYVTDDEVRSGIVVWKSLVDANVGQTLEEGVYWTDVTTADQLRWLKLIEGQNYVYSNRVQKWYGMKAMVKPLIASLWMADNSAGMSNTGKSVPNIENAVNMDAQPEISRAWNRYQLLACGAPLFTFYPNRYPYYNGYLSNYDSLYGYLYSVSDDFVDVVEDYFPDLISYMSENFHNPGRMNQFGI
jgi:hypothetical protein